MNSALSLPIRPNISVPPAISGGTAISSNSSRGELAVMWDELSTTAWTVAEEAAGRHGWPLRKINDSAGGGEGARAFLPYRGQTKNARRRFRKATASRQGRGERRSPESRHRRSGRPRRPRAL